ncbi:hypothetical protein R5W24_001934 [Gemmata sp. JC717]|uniref:TIGR03943 family protein n=1 Tax=Gemmata algarum TaxID=2975278 RepID=A0ABU5EYK1_9BACT|nr:hypothetical protein [Gemmata algarum]MDY3552845.1 hypothetical protein [Gemmata algarum]MDY3559547.1 hypothetical protein [Gemmata algarum]
MAHSHAGCQSPRDYFTEQLLTIFVCGGLGFVAIQLYRSDMLRHILAPQFHLPVLIGGIVVFVLVLLRAITVWREAGELVPVDSNDPTCRENHVHTASCNHLPGLPGAPNTDENLVDDHGHSHDMSWVFARMLILVFPITLYFLGIPNTGLSADAQRAALGNEVELQSSADLAQLASTATVKSEEEKDGIRVRVLQTDKGFQIREVTEKNKPPVYSVVAQAGIEMRFNDLTEAAFSEDKRRSYAGSTAILEGRFNPLSDKQFTLFRQKMTCCGQDSVMLKVRIISPQVVSRNYFDWVRVKGVIDFVKAPGAEERYVPVLRLQDVTDVTLIPKDQIKNEYEF